MKLKTENDVLTKLEHQHMGNEARQKRVLLFEDQNLIHEEKDLKQLLHLAKKGYDLERISEEMDHLTFKELILISLHLCYSGKLKKFLLSWDVG